jgi:hypothetical protein
MRKQEGASLAHIIVCFLSRTYNKCSSINIIQINHQPDATIFQFIILMFIYSSTCFGRFPAHHQELIDCSGSFWFYLRIHYHHDKKVKPEAATAVIELLMMGGKKPKTC